MQANLDLRSLYIQHLVHDTCKMYMHKLMHNIKKIIYKNIFILKVVQIIVCDISGFFL